MDAGSSPAMTAVGVAADNHGDAVHNMENLMPRFLKRGMDASAIKAADAKVRETVEGILAQVEDQKDAAIRDLSKKFDNWEPKDFRLTPAEIEKSHLAGSQARSRRHQVRPGAGAQLRAEAERDDEGSGGGDAARRYPRPPPHPGECHRLLRAGRTLSDGRLRAYVDRHRARRGREAHHRLRAAVQGRAASGDRRGDAFRRRRRNLRARRRAGGGRDGARHRDASRRWT